MRRIFTTVSAVVLVGVNASAMAAECRTVDNIRIDSADQLHLLDDVCVVTQNLAIFPDDLESLVLPDLKTARLINIDSRSLKAVAMPNLEKASWLYLQSPRLEAIELSRLSEVSQTFGVNDATSLVYLSTPALAHVGKLYLQDNPALKFIFAEQLEGIGTLVTDHNPALDPSCLEYLSAAAQTLSPSLRQQRRDVASGLGGYRQAVVTSYIDPNIRPTGHPTYFGTIGFAPVYVRHYYNAYPHHYDGLWAYYLGRYHFYNWLGRI